MRLSYSRVFLVMLSKPVQRKSERYNPVETPDREAAWIDACQRASTVWQ
ncbi:MAG TPA: hypothetical protein VLL94_01135 [Nitrospiraceae bacterium]|nr:hypothetical protein [Nitrospiraceae bacterium]